MTHEAFCHRDLPPQLVALSVPKRTVLEKGVKNVSISAVMWDINIVKINQFVAITSDPEVCRELAHESK